VERCAVITFIYWLFTGGIMNKKSEKRIKIAGLCISIFGVIGAYWGLFRGPQNMPAVPAGRPRPLEEPRNNAGNGGAHVENNPHIEGDKNEVQIFNDINIEAHRDEVRLKARRETIDKKLQNVRAKLESIKISSTRLRQALKEVDEASRGVASATDGQCDELEGRLRVQNTLVDCLNKQYKDVLNEVSSDDGNPRLQELRAFALLNSGQYKEAKKAYQFAVDRWPNDSEFRLGAIKAEILSSNGMPSKKRLEEMLRETSELIEEIQRQAPDPAKTCDAFALRASIRSRLNPEDVTAIDADLDQARRSAEEAESGPSPITERIQVTIWHNLAVDCMNRILLAGRQGKPTDDPQVQSEYKAGIGYCESIIRRILAAQQTQPTLFEEELVDDYLQAAILHRMVGNIGEGLRVINECNNSRAIRSNNVRAFYKDRVSLLTTDLVIVSILKDEPLRPLSDSEVATVRATMAGVVRFSNSNSLDAILSSLCDGALALVASDARGSNKNAADGDLQTLKAYVRRIKQRSELKERYSQWLEQLADELERQSHGTAPQVRELYDEMRREA
jgi:hypothetical protein